MTKQEQYEALAKMLPESVMLKAGLLEWKSNNHYYGRYVVESELLQLCWDARATLGEDYSRRVDFLNALRGILADRLKRTVSDFDLLQATPEENIEALAKVKGI